ncbi:MAG: hypothetical protein HOH43_04575 [Candidatus Latescibacteria bacterium]|nr:hypothetical protein [Candidatus Latescibacterota bacterium]
MPWQKGVLCCDGAIAILESPIRLLGMGKSQGCRDVAGTGYCACEVKGIDGAHCGRRDALVWAYGGESSGCDRPARLSISSSQENLEKISERWRLHFAQLNGTDHKVQIAYTNSQGQSWSSTGLEIYTHVSFHGAYHRGQIAAELSALGNEPAYTDFIHATRQRLV